jgi:hypothetical protein
MCPDLRTEQLIIGFVTGEAERIGYGKLVLEVTIYNGKATNIQGTEVRRSFNLNS